MSTFENNSKESKKLLGALMSSNEPLGCLRTQKTEENTNTVVGTPSKSKHKIAKNFKIWESGKIYQSNFVTSVTLMLILL